MTSGVWAWLGFFLPLLAEIWAHSSFSIFTENSFTMWVNGNHYQSSLTAYFPRWIDHEARCNDVCDPPILLVVIPLFTLHVQDKQMSMQDLHFGHKVDLPKSFCLSYSPMLQQVGRHHCYFSFRTASQCYYVGKKNLLSFKSAVIWFFSQLLTKLPTKVLLTMNTLEKSKLALSVECSNLHSPLFQSAICITFFRVSIFFSP